MDPKTLAYIAGFFDGEGYADIVMVKAGAKRKRYPKLIARLTQTDRDVLEWISEQFGCGRIYCKPDRKAHWSACYDLTFTHRQARIFLAAIEPYLRVKGPR